MLLKYRLTDSQHEQSKVPVTQIYIQNFADSIGCTVSSKLVVDDLDTWDFAGKFTGTATLVKCDPTGIPVKTFSNNDHWELWLKITKKPWYVPRVLINFKIKKLLAG
jgi:hypothetical protein